MVRRSAPWALALLVAACGGDDGPPTAPPDSTDPPAAPTTLEVTPDAVSLHALGDSSRLLAVVRDADGDTIPDATIAWASTDPAVVSVNAAGWVVAEDNGAAQIVATSGALADTATLEVAQRAADVALFRKPPTLAQGDTLHLAARAWDANGVEIYAPSLTWSSSDAVVATVEPIPTLRGQREAVVTAVRGGGAAVITAQVDTATTSLPITVMDRIAFVVAADGGRDIYIVNEDGSGPTRLTTGAMADTSLAWSPDGARIAFADGTDILVVGAASGAVTNLTDGALDHTVFVPFWSPDAKRIGFWINSFELAAPHMYVIDDDGTGLTDVTGAGGAYPPASWSPDGSRIFFTTYRDGNAEVYAIDADGVGLPTNLTNRTGDDGSPVLSPDGTRIAFISERDATTELYLMQSDGSGVLRITTSAGVESVPAWRPRP